MKGRTRDDGEDRGGQGMKGRAEEEGEDRG